MREFDRLDPRERDYWVAEWHMSREECSQHGGPLSECSDPDKPWFPQMSVCNAAIEAASAKTLWELKHKDRPWHNGDFSSWAAEPSVTHSVHRDAGVNIWVAPTDLGVGGDFLSGVPGADSPR